MMTKFIIFVRLYLQGYLIRFGGYGYFNSNKTMIYYDEVSNQWDIVKYKGYQLIKGFNNVQLHFIKQ